MHETRLGLYADQALNVTSGKMECVPAFARGFERMAGALEVAYKRRWVRVSGLNRVNTRGSG